MMAINIEQTADKQYCLQGEINYNTVIDYRRLGEKIIRNQKEETLCFSLAQVTCPDSSALLLLLAWLRLAKLLSKSLQFVNMPDSLTTVASVYCLVDIL